MIDNEFLPEPFARFLRTVGDACLTLARDLESMSPPAESTDPLDKLALGSLQRSVVEVLVEVGEDGISPRQLTKRLDRGDEPNVRSTLESLRRRGVTELVPGVGPQRWRLTAQYR